MAEPQRVHLAHHGAHTVGPLGPPLGQEVQVPELGRHEQARRGVGASGDARAAADACRRVHRLLGVRFGHEHRVRLGRAPGSDRDVAPVLDDAIEGAPVDDEILDDRERARAPRLDGEAIPVPEVPQVKLAGRRRGHRAVGPPVDPEAAGPANPFAAIVVERDWVLACGREHFVGDVDPPNECHSGVDAVGLAGFEAAYIRGAALSLLVIARLPFSVPTDPVFRSRSELYDDPFRDYSLPSAILRFRQGFGRLIRDHEDRGAVVVLDRRIFARRYGEDFVSALPECARVKGSAAEIMENVEDWLHR